MPKWLEANTVSVRMIAQVWQDTEITDQTHTLIMLALADYANDHGVCWPAWGSIAKKCRCSRTTVWRIVRELVNLNKIEVKSGGERAQTNTYRLKLKPFQSETLPSQVETEPSQSLKPLPSQSLKPDPSGNHHDPPKGGVAASRSPKNKDGSEVFLLNQALEIAPPSAKKELLKQKRAVLGKHFSVDLSPKPSVTASSSPEISIPPADPATIQKHIDEAKAAVAAATPARTVKRTIKEQRQKLPPA